MKNGMMRFVLSVLFLVSSFAFADGPDPKALVVAPGYSLEVYRRDIDGARSLAHSSEGTVFVGTRGKKVYALKGDRTIEIAKDLDTPNGIAWKGGDLYVGETKRIVKFPEIDAAIAAGKIPKPVVVFDGLPKDGGHDWRYMRFAPDGSLYVAIGAPCNICNREKDEPRFATIMRFAKLDGSAPEIYARGIRNSVGFDWNPKTKALWFTENGRDWLGDDSPEDELNRADRAGLHFGYPYCHAGTIPDPKLAEKRTCAEFTPPAAKLGPHVAALGMRFLDANTALVALHGSWNRSSPIGYRVVRVKLGGAGAEPKIESFVDGFRTKDGKVRGRPVDLDVQADGAILISDDEADAVYRVRKVKP